jgi:hypothetical protein
MADYQDIRGLRVKYLSADPSNTAAGEVWYNSTTGTLKSHLLSSAWSSSAPISTGRINTASTGTQTASLLMGGLISTPTKSTAVEQYNGTGWTTETAIPTATVEAGGAGTVTAALFAGGFTAPPPPGASATFEYDGSSWTTTGSMGAGRTNLTSAGTQTAALVAGGTEAASPNPSNRTELYNGSTWSDGPTLGTARYQLMCSNVGLQTAALAIGGYSGGALDIVESYDGSSWTATTVLPTAGGNQARYGTTTAAVCAGGGPGPGAETDVKEFDGTTWTVTPSLANGRNSNSGSGTTTAGVIGGSSPFGALTEEYNVGTTVITPGAWASGGAINTARQLAGSAIPSQNAGIIFGGSAYTAATEQYNGATWTTVPGTLNTPRGYISGFGTETAAVAAGGYTTPAPGIANVEEYDGSTWTEVTNVPTTLLNAGNCGTITAGLLMGGSTLQPFTSGLLSSTSEYDGTNWTAGGTLPAARGQGMSGGTQTAAYYAGGYSPGYVATTIEYDGTNYSAGGDLAFGTAPSGGFQGSIGTLTAGLAVSGTPGTYNVNTYDGTSWFTAPAFTTQSNRGMSGGTQTAAIKAGGSGGPGYVDATEEFTGETSAANIETLTTS